MYVPVLAWTRLRATIVLGSSAEISCRGRPCRGAGSSRDYCRAMTFCERQGGDRSSQGRVRRQRQTCRICIVENWVI
ncbi:hypothetical protein EDB83DRAFT_2415071, partial [Lactarius deliciosus]